MQWRHHSCVLSYLLEIMSADKETCPHSQEYLDTSVKNTLLLVSSNILDKGEIKALAGI